MTITNQINFVDNILDYSSNPNRFGKNLAKSIFFLYNTQIHVWDISGEKRKKNRIDFFPSNYHQYRDKQRSNSSGEIAFGRCLSRPETPKISRQLLLQILNPDDIKPISWVEIHVIGDRLSKKYGNDSTQKQIGEESKTHTKVFMENYSMF